MLRVYETAKRIFDVSVATTGLVVLSPLLGATALAVRLTMGSPVIFRQERGGRYGRAFTIYKFRTMRDARDGHGKLLSDEERLTALGRCLRSTSIDELPQLFNVVAGSMSIVGPRPLVADYVPLYSERQALRLSVRPGITGWSAVRGRNSLDWETQLELDAWYAEHRGFVLDAIILILTVKVVLLREGIAQEGTASRDRFQG